MNPTCIVHDRMPIQLFRGRQIISHHPLAKVRYGLRLSDLKVSGFRLSGMTSDFECNSSYLGSMSKVVVDCAYSLVATQVLALSRLHIPWHEMRTKVILIPIT